VRSRFINPVILLTSFLLIWLFQPGFGQVNLWLDGSINYLWAAVLSLTFIQGYINFFLKGKFSDNKISNILFILLSFIVGCYNETEAGSMIIFSVGMVVCAKIVKKERTPWLIYASLIACLCGFAFLMTAPAESAKVGGNSIVETLSGILKNIPSLISSSQQIILLFLLATVVLAVSFITKVNRNTLIISTILYISALASWGCLAIAAYIAQRSLFLTAVLLTLLIATLMYELLGKGAKLCRYMCCAISIVAFLLASTRIPAGIKDIRKTFEFTDGNEKYIIACAESGIKEVHIEVTYEDFPTTKYPAINGLRYLAESPNDYPNVYMAKYYGVDRIYLDYAP
jgi:hypothetical protein